MEARKSTTYITPADDRVPHDWRLWTLVAAALATGCGVYVIDSIKQPYPEWPAQWPEYFRFADRRVILGVPNFGDVVSNVPFLFTGAWGCFFMWHCQPRRDGHVLQAWEKWAAFAMFAFVFCTGLGSAWFHWHPQTTSLFWDRLPIAIVFMLLFALVIGERLSMQLGRRLLPLLVLAGASSVFYWRWTELHGHGDVRPYGMVQFYPMLAIPFLLIAYPPRYTHTRSFIGIFACYIVAKVLENQDVQVFTLLGGAVSGHSLKHLAAAAATWFMVDLFRKRRALL